CRRSVSTSATHRGCDLDAQPRHGSMTETTEPRATAVHRAERLSCFNLDDPRVGNRWPAVWSIGAGSFSLVFAEVIPVGLLAPLSRSLHVQIGAGGLTIVV